MAIFKIEIACDNASYEEWQVEVARLLRKLADALDRDDGRCETWTMPLLDTNGNKVGSANFER